MNLTRGPFRRTCDHWWWRPGWSHGARYATFHLTFELAPELEAEAARCQPALSRVANLDVVPPKWLHLTMTGVGFTDVLDPERLARLTAAVFDDVRVVKQEPLTLDGVFLGREGLSLTAEPAPWLGELKRIQENAVADVFGVEQPSGQQVQPARVARVLQWRSRSSGVAPGDRGNRAAADRRGPAHAVAHRARPRRAGLHLARAVAVSPW